MYKKSYYDLLNTGHNCYYRMMRRTTMDWRKLLMGMALRFLAILRKEHAEVSSDNASYIFDDTTLEKIDFCHNCRWYKCYYIALRGKLGDQPVRIFL